MLEILKECPQVVLLGNSPYTRGIIKSLNRDYFISPILFASHRPEGCSFFLQYSFLKQQLPDNEYYTLQSILDISNEFGRGNNYILIPLSESLRNFIQTNLEQLESTYIISNQSELIAALPSFKSDERNL